MNWVCWMWTTAALTCAGGSSDDSELVGLWRGGIVHQGSIVPVDLEVVDQAGSLQALLTVETLNQYRAPVPLTIEGGRVEFATFGTTWSLSLDERSMEMRGAANIADVDATLHLLRMRNHGPLPIHSEEVEIESAGEVVLSGTLTRPTTEGLHPAIVLLTGRSYGSRQPNLRLAAHLASHGIAALCFDGRGAGRSEGEAESVTQADRIADTLAAVELLASDPELDPEQIGLFGTSAGAWVCAETVAVAPEIAFLVFEVGPVEDVADQQASVARYRMLWSGENFSEEEIAAAEEFNRSVFQSVMHQQGFDELAPRIEKAKEASWSDYVSLPSRVDDPSLRFFFLQPYDPVPALRALQIPLLAIYGERDFVVPPQANVPKLHALMAEAGNTDYEVVVYPDVGHGLSLSPGMTGEGDDWPERYFQWPRGVPGFCDQVSSWILDHVDTAAEVADQEE